jgi:hypothetical protein
MSETNLNIKGKIISKVCKGETCTMVIHTESEHVDMNTGEVFDNSFNTTVTFLDSGYEYACQFWVGTTVDIHAHMSSNEKVAHVRDEDLITVLDRPPRSLPSYRSYEGKDEIIYSFPIQM